MLARLRDRVRVRSCSLRSAHLSAGVVTALVVAVAPVAAAPLTCQRVIVKATAQYVQTTIRVLQRCRDRVVAGGDPVTCPDATAAAKIARAEEKLRDAISQNCGGGDHQCGTGGDDDPLDAIGWDLGSCPGFGSGSCGGPIAHCADIGTCLMCVAEAAVDHAIGLSYDDLNVPNGTPLVQCQRAIGKKAALFVIGKAEALQHCENEVLKGLVEAPCPDARAASRIARLEGNLHSFVCRACSRVDAECGGPDDWTPEQIGFRDQCPDVTVPGGAACGGPVDDLTDLVACLACVANFTATCVDKLTVPGLGPYPPECADAPAVCGNGVIEPGEACEPPNLGCGLLESCRNGCTRCSIL